MASSKSVVLEHPSSVPDEPGMRYKYRRIEDAPVAHREILRFAMFGLAVEEISTITHSQNSTIRRVLEHQPNEKYLRLRLTQRHIEQLELLENIGEGRSKSVQKLLARIEDDTNDALSDTNLLKFAQFMAERHPDGVLVKRTKTDITSNHNVVDGHELNRLKELAARAGIVEAQESLAIDVEAKEVKEARELQNAEPIE